MEGDFQREASSSWAKSTARSFDLKTKYLASDLLKWIRKKPSICSQLEVIEKSINQIQASQPAQQDHGLEKHLIQQHHNILEKQAEFHKQRFKKLWTLEGDRNTHFFQQAILKRARRNRIVYLTDDQGQPLTTHDQITACFNNYFKALFTSQLQQQQNSGTSVANIHETSTTDSFLDSIPDKEEIWQILRHMKSDAAPGPDGFNVAFYRAAWPWIGDDVTTLVHNFYRTGTLPPEINKTFFLSLSPRKMLLCFLRILDPSVFALLYTKLLLNLWLIESNLTCLIKYTCHSQLSFLVGISLLILSQLRKSLILLVSLLGKIKASFLKLI